MKLQLHKRLSWQTVWQVVGEVATGRMPAHAACQWLTLSRAQLYRLKARWLQRWEQAPQADWLYQRAGSVRSRLPAEVQSFLEDECRYWKAQSPFFRGHFNFAFLAEQCHQRFGRRFHRNTLRRWAIQQGLFDPQTDTPRKACVRFETGGIGVLYQHDASHHAWLPLTHRQDVLIATIDDHSRKLVGARLVPRETTWHHLCVVRETVETTGCPLAYYTDNHMIFAPDTELDAQFSRALRALAIDLKLTGKAQPQAKGKIEKRFDYLQRRIPLLCEQYRITSLTAANRLLRDQVAYYNECHVHAETLEIPEKRWRKALEEGRTYLRPLPEKTPLDLIFGLHYRRALRTDGSFSFHGQRYVMPEAPGQGTVTVVLRPPTGPRRPHTELFVLYKNRLLHHFVLPQHLRPTLR